MFIFARPLWAPLLAFATVALIALLDRLLAGGASW
jgi:hypothetical protein